MALSPPGMPVRRRFQFGGDEVGPTTIHHPTRFQIFVATRKRWRFHSSTYSVPFLSDPGKAMETREPGLSHQSIEIEFSLSQTHDR